MSDKTVIQGASYIGPSRLERWRGLTYWDIYFRKKFMPSIKVHCDLEALLLNSEFYTRPREYLTTHSERLPLYKRFV